MTDAVAQVKKEGRRPAEQQHHADRRGDKRVCGREDFAPGRHGDEPPGEQDRADREGNAGKPMQDRQRGRDLEAIPDRKHEG
jgi:hypothetical protein